jgi:predicted dehydrogenase
MIGGEYIPQKSALEILGLSDLELIVIATPKERQIEFLKLGLLNKKYIYCEKPLGSTPLNLTDRNFLRRNTNSNIFIGFQFRFDPMIRACLKIINSFPTDTDIVIQVEWKSVGGKRFLETYPGTERIWGDFGCHVLDYLQFICSKTNKGDLKLLEVLAPCGEHSNYPNLCTKVRLSAVGIIFEVNICRLSEIQQHEISINSKVKSFVVGQRYPFTSTDFYFEGLEFPILKNEIADIRTSDATAMFDEISNQIKSSVKSPQLATVSDVIKTHCIISEILRTAKGGL